MEILIIRPNEDISIGLQASGTPHYAQVNEETLSLPPSGESFYNYIGFLFIYPGGPKEGEDIFGYQNHTDECGLISKLVFHFIWGYNPSMSMSYSHYVIVNGLDHFSTDASGTTEISFSKFHSWFQLNNNIATSNPWTWQDIDDLRFGWHLQCDAHSGWFETAQMYVEVYFTRCVKPINRAMSFIQFQKSIMS